MRAHLFICLICFLLLNNAPVQAQSMKLLLEGDAWSGVNEYPVKGRQGILINQKLSFGNYFTSWIAHGRRARR